MNPAATPPDPRAPRRLVAGCALAACLLAAAGLLSLSGCSKPPLPVGEENKNSGVKGDPWKAAAARLKKDTDLTATKAALTALASDISSQDAERLPAHTPESLAALAKHVPLSAEDQDEIRGSAFSGHDPAYLADCLYMRDAARSLATGGLPPERQAELAFEWVCRQVYLYPWLRNVRQQYLEPTVLPPTAVLRRGFGSGLERAYVFLALLQQLDMQAQGCLIGPPDARGVESRQGPPIAYPFVPDVRVPRGPFWAVGVRVGDDVRLFDPWRGRPLPVTLKQLKEKPDSAKAWFEDKGNVSGATLKDAEAATPYLAVPVNSLSPRMATFEAKLRPELGVKLAYDLKALEAMGANFPGGKAPAFWNPPQDPYAYGRVARAYLPLDMGGSDRGERGTRLYDLSLFSQIPPSAFAPPPEFAADLRDHPAWDRLSNHAASLLGLSFVEPPNPRELIQRGRFQDAAKDLVEKQEAFAKGLERLRTQSVAQQAEQIREWIRASREAYDEVTRARVNNNKEDEARALKLFDDSLKQAPARWLVDKVSADVGRAEAAFLLALCKHEEAERQQVRLERTAGAEAERRKGDALDAWRTALAAWRNYEQLSTAHGGFPGRSAHARALAARAADAIDPPKKPEGKKEEPPKK